MPERFPSFSPDQAQALADEFDQLGRRLVLLVVVLAAAIAIGLAAALYTHQRDQQKIARASCDATARLAGVLQIALPKHHVAGRTEAQQRNIDKFYRAINQKHLLNPPGC